MHQPKLSLIGDESGGQVPAAFFCAHGPHVFAELVAGKAYDNSNPRDFMANITNDTLLNEKVLYLSAAVKFHRFCCADMFVAQEASPPR